MAEAPSSDDDVSAAIVTLLCHLPEKFQGLWWTINEYCDMLRRGGLKDGKIAQVCNTVIDPNTGIIHIW
jgi:hypothetical protein